MAFRWVGAIALANGYRGGAMNKSELIEIIAENSNITKKKAEDVVNLVFSSMTNSLLKGDRIEIRGFGSFVNKYYGPYVGRNPRTGESIQVNAKRLPFFKVGKELRERVDIEDDDESGDADDDGDDAE
jgi:integration host factor subunit beta